MQKQWHRYHRRSDTSPSGEHFDSAPATSNAVEFDNNRINLVLMSRRMVEAAEEQQRVILTRDRAFVLARYSHAVYWVRSDNKRAQLLEILKEFDLEVPEADLLSRCVCSFWLHLYCSRYPDTCPLRRRCAKCNGEFIPRPLSSEEIPTSCNVPAGVLDRQDEFFMCAKCESVYWKGSQYAAAMGRLTKMTASFTLS